MATPFQTATTWPLVDGLHRSPALTSLGLVAGFTTRAEGSLAGSVFPQDEQDRSRERLARRLGFAEVVRVRQMHGNKVIRVPLVRPDPALPAPAEPRSKAPEGDAMWTDEPGVLLGVAAADCVPVLVAEASVGGTAGAGKAGPGRTFIGLAHAGWEGTTKRVTGALVRELVTAGADGARLVAAIGPSIGPCCYAIDEARAATIRSRLGEGPWLRGGPASGSEAPRWSFDLWGANATQLADAGVRSIELAELCTRCGGADLWSYRSRGERGPQGTGLAVLGRPKERP